jgi:hypothetical protein
VSLPVGTRIRFLRDLHGAATEDQPACTYALKGDSGVVTGHDCKEGHWVRRDGWMAPFGATLGTEFEDATAQPTAPK